MPLDITKPFAVEIDTRKEEGVAGREFDEKWISLM